TTSFVYIVDDPFVPNAISPDGDGINDYLKIPFLSGFPGNKVVIYNRWGKKVYEGDDYKNDWNGDDLPAGTYFYVVNAPNMKSELKGSVTILRN
ncbi:MAG TPA: gliding motility-associated C-terminal domain-containing protein, partial [Flavobacteriales bacterium]|nr:gliding motility-associated C-terminal domain-containing protein [Flavobacteriales bacterium]